MSKEDYGHSAHSWSFYLRVGSLSRIGIYRKKNHTKDKHKALGVQPRALYVKGKNIYPLGIALAKKVIDILKPFFKNPQICT